MLWLSCYGGFSALHAKQPFQPEVVNPLEEAWRWKQFPELEGKGVRQVTESSDNRVWVGSNQGLFEYNGYDWKMHGEADGLPEQPIQRILATDEGPMYAATESGIFKLTDGTWSPIFETSIDHPFIFHQLKELDDRSIITCTNWGVIHFRENGKVRFYTSPAKITSLSKAISNVEWITLPEAVLNDEGDFAYTSDVLEERSGAIWFAITTNMEGGSLLRVKSLEASRPFADGQFFAASDQLPLGEGQKMLQADDGDIWVISSTVSKGILIYNGQDWSVERIGDRFEGDEYMTDLTQSDDGTIWIGSIARLFSYKSGRWAVYRAPKFPVPPNRILLYHGSQNRLWVLGRRSKILHLDLTTERWLTYKDLSFQLQVSTDEEWFLARNNRIVLRSGNRWTSYGTEDGLPDAPIRISRTSQGQLWVTGSHKGKAATAVLRADGWEMQVHDNFSWGIDYRAVFEDRDGGLWFGAAVDADPADGYRSGVLYLKNPLTEQFEWVHHCHGENGLEQANSYGIGQSPDGRIWMGGTRLLNYANGRWNPHPDERLQQFVNFICSTDELLLVGSRYYGLFVFDGQTWTNYNTSDGLPSNTIISIDVLTDGTFLIATENSICRFDGVNWTPDIFPEELNMDFEGGTLHHTEGHIWINHVPRNWKRRASRAGAIQSDILADFFTTRYRPGNSAPETQIDFSLKTISPQGNCLISWSAKDYFTQSNADQLSYSYRLNKGEWSPFSPEKQKNFINLSNGDYTLEVRARNLDFITDATPAVTSFKVLPPIWKRAWFLSLILLFVVIYGVYEYRVITKKRKLEILNRSLQVANKELRNRQDQIERQNSEILTQQSQIVAQATVLKEKNDDLAERNEEIRLQHGQLEQMVRQIEDLSRTKLNFFTNISHELRTPLSLILGPAQQLENAGAEISRTEQNKLQKIISRNASRLLKLINQLLEVRQIEQQSLAVKMSSVSLPQYLHEIVALFENLATERAIELIFTDHTIGRPVLADIDKVEKILVNILSNAFKFTNNNGQINLDLRRVTGKEHDLNSRHETYFELRVSDTGCGINAERLPSIFDKFHSSTSTIAGVSHSGIGLSYVRELVRLLEGDIRVESQPGRGTTFTVFLPYVQPDVPVNSKLPELASEVLYTSRQEVSLLFNLLPDQVKENSGQRASVTTNTQKKSTLLIVDDNPDMRNFLRSLLEQDFSILLAEDGHQGYQMAESENIDLILSDVMMPRLDGISLCGKLKTEFSTSHIPVILLTAKVLDDSKASGYLQGADDYISKPFNPDLLKIRINNLLDQREKLRNRFSRNFLLEPQTEQIVSADEELLARLVELMNENVDDAEFNVNRMCQMVNLSHTHFIRKVKQLTGKKPADLLKSFRMKKAKELLGQRKLTITEVAYRVGFDLPNSFSRAFKKEYGISPTEFVRNLPTPEVEGAVRF